jgi:hypothetical protein
VIAFQSHKMMGTKGTFDAVWDDAIAAEAAVLQERQIERSYRRVLAMTDEVLTELEQRNLRGERMLDDAVRRDLARTLAELPPDARRRYPDDAASVQRALDGVFLVQESLLVVLQRLLHWDRLVA